MRPPSTSGPTGCRASSNLVTTPKLPPPPRSAQNSSGFCDSEACATDPSAVTSSTDRRLSQVSPYLRTRWPNPPPSVKPPMPVLDTSPPVVASPCCWVAASNSFHLVPPPANARRNFTSTSTSFSCERSRTTPSSQVEKPATL